jgi:hypothetical protein
MLPIALHTMILRSLSLSSRSVNTFDLAMHSFFPDECPSSVKGRDNLEDKYRIKLWNANIFTG